MADFCLPEGTLLRLKTFLNSREAGDLPEYSLTESWRNHHDQIKVDFGTGKVAVAGGSGYYIPTGGLTDRRSSVLGKTLRMLKYPRTYTRVFKAIVVSRLRKMVISELRLDYELVHLDAGTAFDAIMTHHPKAGVQISPHRVNFLDLQKSPAVMASTQAVKRNYAEKIGLDISSPIMRAYYDYNIIVGLTNIDTVKTILEIGAGSGNLASVLFANHRKRHIIVDLPKTLCLAIPFLSAVFPEAKIVMPHEANEGWREDADFVFLTPAQIHLIPDDSLELAINTISFQEMSRRQISEYFALVQRACKHEGYFYTKNGVEKLPDENIEIGTSEPVIRFSEYPWNHDNRVLAHEICRLNRLSQRDQMFLRLEQIRK